jgi:hypothetical protein
LVEFPAAQIGKSVVFGRKCQIHQRFVVRGVSGGSLSARISIGLRKNTSAVLQRRGAREFDRCRRRPTRVRPLSADRAVIRAAADFAAPLRRERPLGYLGDVANREQTAIHCSPTERHARFCH